MFDIIFAIVVPFAAFWGGYIYRDFLLFKDLRRVAKQLDDTLSNKLKETIPNHPGVTVNEIKKLKHEIHYGVHYFFVENNNQFVCQGQSLIEAAKNYTLAVGKDNLGVFNHSEQNKEYCFVNSECLEFINE